MDNPTLDVNMIEEQHSIDTFTDEFLWATFLPVGQGFSKCGELSFSTCKSIYEIFSTLPHVGYL